MNHSGGLVSNAAEHVGLTALLALGVGVIAGSGWLIALGVVGVVVAVGCFVARLVKRSKK